MHHAESGLLYTQKRTPLRASKGPHLHKILEYPKSDIFTSFKDLYHSSLEMFPRFEITIITVFLSSQRMSENRDYEEIQQNRTTPQVTAIFITSPVYVGAMVAKPSLIAEI